MSSTPKKFRVAVVLETYGKHGRAALRGIASYAEQRSDWEFYSSPMGDTNLEMLRASLQSDGVITRLREEWRPLVRKARVPVVGVFCAASADLPAVHTNARKIAEMAVEHFIAQGFRQFAFVGPSRNFSSQREKAFRGELERRGYTCHSLLIASIEFRRFGWLAHKPAMVKWLLGLPKPIAILAANDWTGQEVLLNAMHAKIHVPDDVAVVGVDNEELICRFTNPPMSSIDAAGERVGFEAAAMLDQLMHGKRLSRRAVIVDPARLIVRQSSDVLAVTDPNVSAAVRFIRENVSQGLNVKTVLREIPVARRTLELAFRKHLGRSIHDEITESRVRRIKQYLIETNMRIRDIFDVCGFKDRTYLSAVFRQTTGHTPSSFRRAFQNPS